MLFSLLQTLVIWCLFWFGFYAVLNWILVPHKISFRRHKIIFVLFSLIFFSAALALFNCLEKIWINLELIVIVVAVTILLDSTFLFLHKRVVRIFKITELREQSTIFCNASEVLFQQAMLNVLIFKLGAVIVVSPLLAASLFGLAHVPIFILKKFSPKYKIFVVLAAFGGGYIFSWLIINLQYGWLWAYAAHFSFYYLWAMFTGDKDQYIP